MCYYCIPDNILFRLSEMFFIYSFEVIGSLLFFSAKKSGFQGKQHKTSQLLVITKESKLRLQSAIKSTVITNSLHLEKYCN